MLNNKVIIVTGGNGLLGRSFCSAIDKHGGIPIIADIDPNGLDYAETLSNGEYIELDITDKESIQNGIDYIITKYGHIDALVNNAYPRNNNYGRSLFDVEYSDFCENINLNIGGYFLISQQLSKYFINQGFGNIINIASIYGIIAPRFEIYEETEMTMPVEYAVIKSAIIHLTKYFSKYLKGKNIHVNTISPGGIFDNQNTKFIEAYNKFALNKGMLPPNAINGTLIYLLSEGAKFINGQNIIVDDGFSL